MILFIGKIESTTDIQLGIQNELSQIDQKSISGQVIDKENILDLEIR